MRLTKTVPDESVKRHRDWQQTLDKDTLFDEIFGDHKQGQNHF